MGESRRSDYWFGHIVHFARTVLLRCHTTAFARTPRPPTAPSLGYTWARLLGQLWALGLPLSREPRCPVHPFPIWSTARLHQPEANGLGAAVQAARTGVPEARVSKQRARPKWREGTLHGKCRCKGVDTARMGERSDGRLWPGALASAPRRARRKC
eukprot:scaffold290218_cov36-Tisochrysis_lutea.AAC.2